MRILGSGKIDDFKKIIFSDRVMKAMDVKPGDSVIFYRKKGENGVCMFRAEDSQLSDECDSPQRLHLRGAPTKLRTDLYAAIAFAVVALVIAALFFNNLGQMGFVLVALFITLSVIGSVLAVAVTRKMDDPSEEPSFVTVGGIYNKDRLVGISKLTTDGYVVSGDLFVNALFSTNPSKVDVSFLFESGTEVLGLVKCVKFVPGYNVYKVRLKLTHVEPGTMLVHVTYLYEGKSIELTATYDIAGDSGTQDIKLTEGPVDSVLKFDSNLNSKTFDESLFDPEDEEA